jgi:hypothetical protein
MKSLFYTILIIGGAFVGYDYFLAPPGQKIVFKSLNPPPKKKVTLAETAPAEKPVTVETAPAPAKPMVVEAPKPVAPTPPPAPEPVKTTSGPKFEPIEVLTGNWLKIPPTAFPREVKLLEDVMFKMSVGASKVAAGGIAFANMGEVMEFAKMMAVANIGVRKHLRGNSGACLAVCVQGDLEAHGYSHQQLQRVLGLVHSSTSVIDLLHPGGLIMQRLATHTPHLEPSKQDTTQHSAVLAACHSLR